VVIVTKKMIVWNHLHAGVVRKMLINLVLFVIKSVIFCYFKLSNVDTKYVNFVKSRIILKKEIGAYAKYAIDNDVNLKF